MHNPISVEFVPRAIPATADTVARRTEVASRLDDLGHLNAATGEVNATETQWHAIIGDAEIPLLDFDVQKLDNGQVAISIAAEVGAVSIGGKPGTAHDAGSSDDTRRQLVTERLEFAERASKNEAPAGYQLAWAPSAGAGFVKAIRDHVRLGWNDGPAGATA